MIPYKNRTLDRTKPVSVYRNLNRRGRWYSIVQDGLVVAHSQLVKLKNCTFHINEAGRQRCLTSGVKNVHAIIKGYVVQRRVSGTQQPLHYNPFESSHFWGPLRTGGPDVIIERADGVWLGSEQKFVKHKNN